MNEKQLEITCPCCSSRILIDVRTGAIVRSRKPEEIDLDTGKPKVGEADWADALGKVRRRTDGAPSKLDDALARERDKGSRLDDLFKKASEKLAPGERGDQPARDE